MNAFIKLHPSILAIYFFTVIAVTMFSSNPVILIISLVASICVYCSLFDFLKVIKQIKTSTIIIIVCTIFNPLFSQNGQTILFEIWKIKITLQSLLFGLSVGIMLTCSILWFICLSEIMTSEKILYLFGRRTPKVALTFSLSLKFVPEFFAKFRSTAQTQKALGLYNENNLKERIKSASDVFLSVCGDVLENSAQTSDSMRARGFGVNKFSMYSNYRFYKQDTVISIIISFLVANLIINNILGSIKFNYYPTLSPIPANTYNILFYLCFALLSFLPIIIKIKEDVKWKYLMSRT